MPDVDRELAALGNHHAWPLLRDRVKQRMDFFFNRLGREFATKDHRPDYDELQWYRGFFAGMKFLLDQPTVEAKKLEKALARENEVNR